MGIFNHYKTENSIVYAFLQLLLKTQNVIPCLTTRVPTFSLYLTPVEAHLWVDNNFHVQSSIFYYSLHGFQIHPQIVCVENSVNKLQMFILNHILNP